MFTITRYWFNNPQEKNKNEKKTKNAHKEKTNFRERGKNKEDNKKKPEKEKKKTNYMINIFVLWLAGSKSNNKAKSPVSDGVTSNPTNKQSKHSFDPRPPFTISRPSPSAMGTWKLVLSTSNVECEMMAQCWLYTVLYGRHLKCLKMIYS